MKVTLSLTLLAHPLQDLGDYKMSSREAALDSLQMFQSLRVAFPLQHEAHSQEVMADIAARIDLDCMARGIFGVFELIQLEIGRAESRVSRQRAGVFFKNLLERVNRVLQSAGFEIHDSEIAAREKIIGIDVKCFLEMRDISFCVFLLQALVGRARFLERFGRRLVSQFESGHGPIYRAGFGARKGTRSRRAYFQSR